MQANGKKQCKSNNLIQCESVEKQLSESKLKEQRKTETIAFLKLTGGISQCDKVEVLINLTLVQLLVDCIQNLKIFKIMAKSL